MPSPIKIIINRGSGKEDNADDLKIELRKLFTENNFDAEIFIAENGEDIFKFTDRALKSDAETVVAGGGDGTISAVASKLFKTDKKLGILPLGTLNHFSRDLEIPQDDLAAAARVIAAGHTKKIDVGEVNGQIFVNNSSIGLYPKIVRDREWQQKKLGRGKWSAAFWAALKILRRHPFLRFKLSSENGEMNVKTPFVFVGNNEYEMDFFNIGTRDRLDDGKLSVYFLHRSNRRGLFGLILRAILGRIRQAKDFEARSTENFQIETGKKELLVAFDGEIKTMRTPLYYCVHPLALRVIVPEKKETENGK